MVPLAAAGNLAVSTLTASDTDSLFCPWDPWQGPHDLGLRLTTGFALAGVTGAEADSFLPGGDKQPVRNPWAEPPSWPTATCHVAWGLFVTSA